MVSSVVPASQTRQYELFTMSEKVEALRCFKELLEHAVVDIVVGFHYANVLAACDRQTGIDPFAVTLRFVLWNRNDGGCLCLRIGR